MDSEFKSPGRRGTFEKCLSNDEVGQTQVNRLGSKSSALAGLGVRLPSPPLAIWVLCPNLVRDLI